jgi:hypothetical protein
MGLLAHVPKPLLEKASSPPKRNDDLKSRLGVPGGPKVKRIERASNLRSRPNAKLTNGAVHVADPISDRYPVRRYLEFADLVVVIAPARLDDCHSPLET